jgi:ATP/maltotriose-dependent transcriptional regulator MalT
MKLVERSNYLDELQTHFESVQKGVGHAAFLVGEAGIGKTTLLNTFLKSVQSSSNSFVGACDTLFTPRPLGPLYDIADQIDSELANSLNTETERSKIFSLLVQKLSSFTKPVVLVFEDVHWADEATLDLIKFLVRRISRLPCLLISTYRDDEFHTRYPLAAIFGELPSVYYSKLNLPRFSREVVESLANEVNWLSGHQLYQLTSGNPFYVTQILSSGGKHAVPERVKDSIMARYNSRGDEVKALWEFISILPSAKVSPVIEQYVEKEFGNCMDECVAWGLIISRPGHLSFNHEIFRMTIEESLPPVKRKTLHKKVLNLLQEGEDDSRNLAQLVHHAHLADEQSLVARLAPKAATVAASVSAHRQAAKLYGIAIDYTEASGEELATLYERHAFESYLTYQHLVAFASQQMALSIWRDLKDKTREGNAIRFLSRLSWLKGDYKQATEFARQAIGMLEDISPTPPRELALAYSNASQMAMLEEKDEMCLLWGNKAIEIASQLKDNEILSHALNNVGTSQLRTVGKEAIGEKNLTRSLEIALDNELPEHAARSYVNLGYIFLISKKYDRAIDTVDKGVKYCNDYDTDLVKYYMIACKAAAFSETGRWKEADVLVNQMMPNCQNVLVKIVLYNVAIRLAMRKGDFVKAQHLLDQIDDLAFTTNEIQRIGPVISAKIELSWLTGKPVPAKEFNRWISILSGISNTTWYYSDYLFWKVNTNTPITYTAEIIPETPVKYQLQGDWKLAAAEWKKLGCPYEQAITLMVGDEKHQKIGLKILDELGAAATSNKFRQELKSKGVRNIPTGPRESTLKNPAKLTARQIDILQLLSKGLPNKEIADQLFISPKTVDHHISAILSKLSVNSRTQAVVESQRLGILKPE